MTITEQLQKNVMVHLREEPDFYTNLYLTNKAIYQIKDNKFYDYKLQYGGVISLIERLQEQNLKFIPTDVLRGHLSNLMLYADLLKQFGEDISIKDNKLELIFENCYLQSLISLNFFLDLEDNDE